MQSNYKTIEWYQAQLESYQYLQGLVLNFMHEFKDDIEMKDKYMSYFGITKQTEGVI
jgi:hypothetical protein